MPTESDPSTRLRPFVAPVSTTEPDSGSLDLSVLDEWLVEDPIVGTGEATHGTSEFSEQKRQLVRYLVEERGVRLLGLEAGFAETLAVDDYVVRDEADPVEALRGLGLWMYQVEEVLKLIEWLRSFNETRPEADRVHVYGVDMQLTGDSAAAVERYLRRVDPASLEPVPEGLERLKAGLHHRADPDALASATTCVSELASQFDQHREQYVSESSKPSWELARRHVSVLDQACRYREAIRDDSKRADAVRDECMAENVSWILDHEDRSAMAVWAHNGHVARGGTDHAWSHRPMGGHLAERYPDRYQAIGFDFDRGSFQAVHRNDDGEPAGLRSYSVGPLSDIVDEWAPESADGDWPDVPAVTLRQALVRGDYDVAFVDIAGAATDRRVEDWLDRSHVFNSIGAAFDPADRRAFSRVCAPSAEFDALFFVEETTAALPLFDSE